MALDESNKCEIRLLLFTVTSVKDPFVKLCFIYIRKDEKESFFPDNI